MQNNNLLNDPHFLASLAMMRGKNRDEALSEATLQVHNMQQVEAQRRKFAQEQFMAQRLPQILHELQGKNQYEAAEILSQAGLSVPEIGLFLERMGIGASNGKPQTFTGADKMQYELYNNPETKALESRVIPGQQAPKKELTSNEQKRLEKVGTAQDAAEETLKLIAEAREAYKVLYRETGEWTKPNTYLSKVTDPTMEKNLKGTESLIGSVAAFSAYSPEAREAKQIIDKVNSHLVQNATKALAGTTTKGNMYLEQLMSKGAPMSNLGPKAFDQVAKTFEREMSKALTKSIFLKEYADMNGTLVGADAAFDRQYQEDGMQIAPQDKYKKYEQDDWRDMERALEARGG